MTLRLVSGIALCAALGCLPESDSLAEYSSAWSPAVLTLSELNPPRGGLGGATGPVLVEAGPSRGEVSADGGDGEVPAPATPLVIAAGTGSIAGSEPSMTAAIAGPDAGAPIAPCSGVSVAELGRCYHVSTETATWQGARAACVNWQGALVKIESRAEDDLVGSWVNETIWLGASDTEVDNVYVWTDGSPIEFGNWGPAQPDAFPGSDCIEKRAIDDGQRWFDQPCDNARSYVCEKPLD